MEAPRVFLKFVGAGGDLGRKGEKGGGGLRVGAGLGSGWGGRREAAGGGATWGNASVASLGLAGRWRTGFRPIRARTLASAPRLA
jgi:hypothetical protein